MYFKVGYLEAEFLEGPGIGFSPHSIDPLIL